MSAAVDSPRFCANNSSSWALALCFEIDRLLRFGGGFFSLL
jgi:hypothetical protein